MLREFCERCSALLTGHELGDGEPSPRQFSTEEQEINALAPGTIRNPASGAAQEVSPHHYISTACLHGQHEKCRRFCKYCKVPCACKNCVHVEEVSPPSPEPRETDGHPVGWCCKHCYDGGYQAAMRLRAEGDTRELKAAANTLIDYCIAHDWGMMPEPYDSINPLLKLLGRFTERK